MVDANLRQSGMRVLWSNRPGEPLTDELIPCFPTVESDAYALRKNEVEFLMTGLSQLYVRVLDSLAGAVAAAIDIDREPCRVILRESVVLTTYVLADRSMRLCKIISQNKLEKFGVAAGSGVSMPKTNAHFIGLIEGSQEFNQYLLYRLATSIWQLQAVAVSKPLISDVRNATPINNKNFDSPGLFTRIKRKVLRELSARTGKVPALRLANIDAALLDASLFGVNRLMWLRPLKSGTRYERDAALRNRILPYLREEISTVMCEELFIRACGLERDRAKHAVNAFCELLLEMIPPDRLEGGARHLVCARHLKSFGAPALFFCAMPSDEDIHWIAAARKLEIPVIGVQHGAHYGFSMQPCHLELEYAYCDKFITWGWSKFPDHVLCRGIEAIPLPSPWLSERSRKWKKSDVIKDGSRSLREYDVLWMTDRLHMFPPTLSTLRLSRLDHLVTLNRTMLEVISGLATSGVRILHKPFNYTSADIQSDLITQATRKYSQHYAVYQQLDKGLTEALLSKCRLVLWDEPGTGFFECLVAGIPAMLLWDRLISCEEVYGHETFLALEYAELVHRTPESLISAINNFLESPTNWLADRQRMNAISRAIEKFSVIDDKWAKQWKDEFVMRRLKLQ
jgi:putative transferase (TIGR04331 family)